MLKKIALGLLMTSVVLVAVADPAVPPVGGLPSLPKFGLPSFGKSGGVPPEKLVIEYLAGSKKIMEAQSRILLALGNKDLADLAAANASNMKEGATTDAIKGAQQVQTDSSAAIQLALTNDSLQLDAAAKKEIAQGYFDLGLGTISYILFVKDAKNYSPSITNINGSVAILALVVPRIPADVGNLVKTFSAISKFSSNNHIDLPKNSEDPTKSLASLL